MAVLKSRAFSPKRNRQCLQFYFKMTGDLYDKLVVWMKQDDSTGNIRKLVKLRTFEGDYLKMPGNVWSVFSEQLHTVLPRVTHYPGSEALSMSSHCERNPNLCWNREAGRLPGWPVLYPAQVKWQLEVISGNGIFYRLFYW